MFGNEPHLIEDILARVIKYCQTHPPYAPGFRPKRKADYLMAGNNEKSLSAINSMHESVSRINSSVSYSKFAAPNQPKHPTLLQRGHPQSSSLPSIYSKPVQQNIHYYEAENSSNLQHNQKPLSPTKKLPTIRHQSATKIAHHSPKHKIPPITAATSKKERTQIEKLILIQDITERDRVIEQLELALTAAQKQVAGLERLVNIKDKRMQLLSRRQDDMFRPIM